MRFSLLLIAGALLCLQGQTPPGKEAPSEAKGMPPRATAADYQAHAQAGAVTIAAEFSAHAVPTLQGALNSEDYVTVEVGLFGADGARTKVSSDDFSLRINGKKTPLTTQPYGVVVGTIKDPEWEPPAPPKSKTGISTGGGGEQGGGGGSNEKPLPPKVPFEVQRAMSLRVQKELLPEGDRALPVAGLIFFRYGGQAKGIHEVELIYAGAAGKATLRLHP